MIEFTLVDFAEIEAEIVAHNEALPSPIDSFAEEHIISSSHYQMLADSPAGAGRRGIGYCSVHGGRTLTQFVIAREALPLGQEAFRAARRLDHVSDALVPTCDELFLSHALDDFREVLKQAYFFRYEGATGPAGFEAAQAAGGIDYRQAGLGDLQLVRANSEDFFDEALDRQLEAGEIYIGFLEGEPVAFGVMELGRIVPSAASIGMYTKPAYRRRGIGRATLTYLAGRCREIGREAIAGCWYYNHDSKKTLESAGLVSGTRYLRVHY